MTRLGVVTALAGEGRCLASRPVRANGLHELSGGTLLSLAGVGPERAGEAAQDLLDRGCTALLSWGCAGGLSPQSRPGDLILADRVLAPDGITYGVDRDWHGRLVASLSPYLAVSTGALAVTGTVLTTCADKQTVNAATGAVAVDMESSAVAALATRAGMPFVVIRAIADDAGSLVPPCVAGSIGRRGQVVLSRLVACLALRPWQWPELLRLGRQFAAARKTLASAAHRLGPGLLAP